MNELLSYQDSSRKESLSKYKPKKPKNDLPKDVKRAKERK